MYSLIVQLSLVYEKHFHRGSYVKKSLKTPKGCLEAIHVYQRADNTMIKIQRTKGKTLIYKTLHSRLKIEQHEPY
jgi:hypothetical protein